MASKSGKGVDLEIYFEREMLDNAFRLTHTRVIFTRYRPQLGNAILKTSLEVQRHSLRQQLLGFAHGPSLRGYVNLQAK